MRIIPGISKFYEYFYTTIFIIFTTNNNFQIGVLIMEKYIEFIADKLECSEKEVEKYASEKIEEFSGLIDKGMALEIMAKDLGYNEATQEDSEYKEFLDKWKPFFEKVVNDNTFKGKLYEVAPKFSDFIYNFKFGLKKNVEKTEGRIFSGNDFSCKLFIISIKKIYSYTNDQEFTKIDCILFRDNEKPILVSCIPPTCFRGLTSKNSYYTLWDLHYEGLKQSESNLNRKYHSGSIKRICKIRKSVQSKLV
jgi:hypothetical protein